MVVIKSDSFEKRYPCDSEWHFKFPSAPLFVHIYRLQASDCTCWLNQLIVPLDRTSALMICWDSGFNEKED